MILTARTIYIFIFTEEITDSNNKFSDGTWTRTQIPDF